MAWRAFFMGMVILLLATTAAAFQCPEPSQMVKQNGKWSAPGGWVQCDYAAPTAKAKIKDFVSAIYIRFQRTDKAWLNCLYHVEDQPGTIYTMLRNTAPLVDYWNLPQCEQRMPNYDCENPPEPGNLMCLGFEGKGVAYCAIKD